MAITIREYLGDEKIAQLESMGFLPSLITDMAKRQYAADKQAKRKELSDVGLDGKLVQSVMRGDINEEEAKNAQKFEDFGSKKHGWGLGAAKTLTGIANTVERVGDFVNPFYEGKHDENGNYTYQNSIEQALRPKIQNAQKLRDDYEKATGETSWGSRLAEIGTEMVGDPINFIGGAGLLSKGSKLAQFGKKTLFFAGTGAASGGVMALGEGKNDEETLKNIGYGAAGGFVLGHAIDQGIQGINKLIAKRQASRVANEADAIDNAQNSEFLDGGNSASGDSVGAELKEAQTMTAREFATKETGLDEVTAKKVVKEAMQGKEKSDWTDADTYADIVKFKNFEIQRDYAKAYGEWIQTAQASINNAREQSAIRYADTQKAINEYQKQGMSPSATRELINAKFKPSADEIDYTRAYNDGLDVDARLAGQGIFYALEKDIAVQAYTPEIYATRLKQRGFSDESVQAFTQAYINKDINIAKDYANSKVADAYENKIQREVANEIRDRDEVGGGFVNEEAKNSGLSDSVSDIGDNASRTGERQASDEQILRQGGRNTSSASQTKRTAQSDEQMEQRPAFKTDGDTDATAASKQMVEEQGSGDNEIRGENFITKQSPELKSDLNVKMDLAPNVRDLSKITTDEISADLDYLANKHPEMFKKPSDVFKLVREIKNEPTHFFNNNRLDYALIVKRVGDNKIGKLAVDKESGEVKHATKVKEKDIKRLDRISRENSKNTGIIQTFIQPGSKSNSELRLPSEIIPKQTQEEYKRLLDKYDVDQFLSDRENVLSKDARHGKNRITDRTIENNDGVGGWEYKLTPAGYEKNYKADFLTTKADVAKIRAGKMDEATFNKLKSDLESSDALGYEYKKGSEYADMEDFEREFGSLYNPKGGKNINANSHIASGLVAGTLNSIDEDGNFNPDRFAAGFLAGLAGSKAVAITTRKMTPKLYNEILGVANKMPQMAKGNPKLLGKLYSNGKDISINSFAGEKAITANVGKLDQAKAMLEKGADEVEIWQKTGWFKDEIDGKWKFEINPRGGELKPNPPRNTVLYNVLNDEKLYEAYPELQLYKVEIASEYNPAALKALGSANGGFIPSQKMLIINEKAKDFKSTLYHEIQHAIQEIEGFSAGASGKDGKYWLAGGEVEARNVQKRMSGVSYDGFKSSTSMEFFPYKEEAQLQRMAGDKEFMEYHELSKKFDDYLNDNGNNLSTKEEARLDELYGKIKDRLGFTEDDYKKGYELYLKEITEYHKHPLHTLDAPRGERVNIDRGDLNLSKELEKKYILKDGSINEATVRKEAEPFIEKEYSLENFKAEFPNGKVDTPVGEVSIESRQFNKLKFKGRENFLGLIKPTLERPAFVVDFEDTTFFFKPFRDKDGVIKFASVIKERDGGLDVVSNYPMKNRKFELITREGKIRYVQGSAAKSPIEHSLDNNVRSSGDIKSLEHSSDGKDIIQQNEEKVYHSRKIEEIKREHPNVEKELDESIAAMNKESFNDSNFKDDLISKFDKKEIAARELGNSVNLSNKQLTILKNDIKNADFKVISDSKIYFDKIGKDGDKKRFFIDIAKDGNIRVDAYAKSQIDNIPIKENAVQELAGVGDRARLKNTSFEVKAAYFNELDPIKKEAILKTAELNKLKKEAQGGDKVAAAKFEEFKAKNLDKDGNIKDGLRLC